MQPIEAVCPRRHGLGDAGSPMLARTWRHRLVARAIELGVVHVLSIREKWRLGAVVRCRGPSSGRWVDGGRGTFDCSSSLVSVVAGRWDIEKLG